MKELSFIIKPEKLERLKGILDKQGCGGITIYTVMGCGNQRGVTDEKVYSLKGLETHINLLPKVKVECVVEDDKVENIIMEVRDHISTGVVGDGKIFIKPVMDAVRIRTGERGGKAI